MARAVTISIEGGRKAQRLIHDTAKRLGSGAVLNVGFLSSARYPNGLNVAQNAFWQEFGTKNQPARPFMRRTIAQYSGEWAAAFARAAKANRYDAVRTLTLMGQGIQGQIVRSIRQLVDPPLSPVTIERKGFDKPLIDTSVMVRNVAYEVVTK